MNLKQKQRKKESTKQYYSSKHGNMISPTKKSSVFEYTTGL